MAGQPNVVVVDEVLAVARPSLYTILILVLCVVIAMAEGYDSGAMAFAAPLVAQKWGLSPQSVGMALSMSFIGTLVGCIVLAPLGDRWGRRPGTILGLFIVGAGTAAGMIAPDYLSLLASRFVAGLGLGLTLPIVLAFVMEILSNRLRVAAVVLISCAYPLGAAVGGNVVSQLIQDYEHRAAFLVGGVMTAIVLVLSVIWLPESPLYLARKKSNSPRLPQLLRRLGAEFSGAARSFVLAEEPAPKSPMAALLAQGRARTTLLLWLLMFSNMAMVMFMTSWLPSLLTNIGRSPEEAIRGTSLYHASGVLGGLLLAILVYWFKPAWVLACAYVVTILAILGLAFLESSTSYSLVIALAGAMIAGTQFCVNAVVNAYYPSSIRATAAGFAGAAGRVGGILAPIAGGIAIAHASAAEQGFLVVIVPIATALLAALLLRSRATDFTAGTRTSSQSAAATVRDGFVQPSTQSQP